MNKKGGPENDIWIDRISVVVLGLVVVFSITGAIMLSFRQLPVPEAVIALGSGAAGSLAGLMIPSPMNRR